MKNLRLFLLPLLLFTFLCTESSAYSVDEDEILVGTRVVPPFVIKDDDGTFSGLTVDLWDHVATELSLTYSFVETDIQGMLDGVANGEFGASASALTITAEREEIVDFSHPFFITGLGIAVSYQPRGFLNALMAVFSLEFLWVVFLLLAVLFFWGFLVWLFERKHNTDEFGGTSAEGIGSGFWWAAVTMTTVGYGDKSPRTFAGRVVGFVWMFAAIILISFFTASIASSLTVTQLDSRVSGAQDLPFVRTGALENSATMEFLAEQRIRATAFSSIEDGLRAVANGDIDAFVHDAPIVRYFVTQEFRNQVNVLPNTFNDQFYGIALPLESSLRNQINQVLLDYIASEDWELRQEFYLGN